MDEYAGNFEQIIRESRVWIPGCSRWGEAAFLRPAGGAVEDDVPTVPFTCNALARALDVNGDALWSG